MTSSSSQTTVNGVENECDWGKLTDGTVFDSNFERADPIEFELGTGQVIKGIKPYDMTQFGSCEIQFLYILWKLTKIVYSRMGLGTIGNVCWEKRKLKIPSKLGYGDQGETRFNFWGTITTSSSRGYNPAYGRRHSSLLKSIDINGDASLSIYTVLELTRDVRVYVQKCLNKGKDTNLQFAIKAITITNGLKYSIATVNWGKANAAGTRAGVSQVASGLRNRSVEMVEAVYSLNKAYLSLPERTASVAGFTAMMTDYYSNMPFVPPLLLQRIEEVVHRLQAISLRKNK
uniref:peptidylprolyl isomerase n=1 Tax=Lactuca sativa TaxID=4236 RepID=A0A9R1WY66_LACSA|nr:hypothetical protein LSAT_V11C800434410 [Lactuca sativa]